MILVAIIALSGVVLLVLFQVLNQLGPVWTGISTYFTTYMPYIVRGIKFLNSFMYANVVLTLVSSIFVAHAVWVTYRLYMWIAKKIPMFGVSD